MAQEIVDQREIEVKSLLKNLHQMSDENLVRLTFFLTGWFGVKNSWDDFRKAVEAFMENTLSLPLEDVEEDEVEEWEEEIG